MRLARALAAGGVCARREAETHIRAGRVTVNGTVVTDVATNVDALHDAIEFDGRRIYMERPTTLVLFKPAGVVTTVSDPHAERTVRDLLPDVRERIFPVGRLDVDTTGVLLMTNDGELAYRLTHPKYGVKKTYRVWVEGRPTEATLRRLGRGIVMGPGERPTAPARVSVVRGTKGGTVLRITLHEGRKHEIKRMCERVGHPCTKLVREKFGGIGLSGLSPGRSRELSFSEIRKLRKRVGLIVDAGEVSAHLDRDAAGASPDAAAAPVDMQRPPAGTPERDSRPAPGQTETRQPRSAPSSGQDRARPAPDRQSRGARSGGQDRSRPGSDRQSRGARSGGQDRTRPASERQSRGARSGGWDRTRPAADREPAIGPAPAPAAPTPQPKPDPDADAPVSLPKAKRRKNKAARPSS